MSTAAYEVEVIWEDQGRPPDKFDHLTSAIGRAVAGTFSTAKAEDAIRAADIPPTRPALDRRRERLLLSTLAAPPDAPKRLLLPASPEDGSSRYRIPRWFALTAEALVRDGQSVEKSTPRRRRPLGWHRSLDITPTNIAHAWTDGSFRTSAGLGHVVTTSEDGSGPIVTQGNRCLGNRQTAFDAEVAAIETALQ